jgi:hypothetical protein
MEVGLKVCEGMGWAQVCDNRFQLGNQEEYTLLASSTWRGSYADQLSNSHILYRQEEWLMSTHRLWHWSDNENSENERSDMMSAVSNPVYYYSVCHSDIESEHLWKTTLIESELQGNDYKILELPDHK